MAMSPEQRQRMNVLCTKLQIENDPKTFTVLAEELPELLESAEHRLESDKEKASRGRPGG